MHGDGTPGVRERLDVSLEQDGSRKPASESYNGNGYAYYSGEHECSFTGALAIKVRTRIPGVGPARKAALRSFGIETAADVERYRIQNVRGFGQSLTRAVLDWRASCERRFTFNPSTAVTDADKNAVKAKLAARKATLESALLAGANELHRFKQQAASKAEALRPRLESAAVRLAQAQKDFSLLQ